MLYVPQFVPQDVCLKCDGCCRFKEHDSAWRPKVYVDEVYAWRQKKPSLADKIYSKQILDAKDRIKAAVHGSECQCRFFDKKDNTCTIYDGRPFECELYPFLLVKKDESIMLSVHLACPHIQGHHGDLSYEEYVKRLKEYFLRKNIQEFVLNNYDSFEDYSGYDNEIQNLFAVGSRQALTPDHALLNHRPIVERNLLNQLPELSTSSFVNIFSWKDFFAFDVRVIDAHVCIFAKDAAGCFLYMPPIGAQYSDKLFSRCFAVMDQGNKKPGVSRIENVSSSQLKFFPEETYAHYKKSDEYLYSKKDIVGLSGNAYKSKRSEFNQFEKNYKSQYLAYEKTMLKECLRLYEEWAKERARKATNDIYRYMLNENRKVHETTMRHCQELGMIGRVVVINEKIVAYTFGFHLTPEVFCILFEIADLSYNGLPVFIFRSFCADEALAQYTLINAMDDFELESLQKTKMSFRPQSLLPTYTVKRKQAA